MDPRPLRILGIAGSLRRASFNRGLDPGGRRGRSRRASRSRPTSCMTCRCSMPTWKRSVTPRPVVALKRAIAEADALLIATPEYNHCVPGVLKNALDWASRPPRSSVLNGKPVAVMGASPGRADGPRPGAAP